MDIFEKLEKNLGDLGQYSDRAHGYFSFPKLEGDLGNRMYFRGKEKIIWSINNYLGLANHPEVRKIDAEAAKQYGCAYPMGARMMSGETEQHNLLEKELSEFVHKEDTFLLNYGYMGIMSTVDSLVDRRDVIVYDSECHASILDGIRMHPGKRYVYKHNDMEDLDKELGRATRLAEKQNGGILVVTEGVFGMAGDQGNLKEIVGMKEKYNFRLVVDDAHGFGTMGKTGAGTGEEQGVQDGIDVYFSTFAKSMASIGAFVSSKKEIITYLKYNMRSQLFAKSLPMPMVVGARKRLQMIKEQPELKDRLWEVVHKLQNGLKEDGFDIGHTNSPVTPVYLKGSIAEATAMAADLRETYDVFCSIVVYPVIPKGQIIYRLIPTASHTDEDIKQTLHAFSEVKKKLDAGKYNVDKIPIME